MTKEVKTATRYPWKEWFKEASSPTGKILKQGRDFSGLPNSMGVQIRKAAKKLGFSVSVFYLVGGTTLQIKRRKVRAKKVKK